MLSGSVLVTPRVNGPTMSFFGTVMPMSRAISTGSHSPVRSSSWAKKVFTDCWVPV